LELTGVTFHGTSLYFDQNQDRRWHTGAAIRTIEDSEIFGMTLALADLWW
jgi:hypothetical protein